MKHGILRMRMEGCRKQGSSVSLQHFCPGQVRMRAYFILHAPGEYGYFGYCTIGGYNYRFISLPKDL